MILSWETGLKSWSNQIIIHVLDVSWHTKVGGESLAH